MADTLFDEGAGRSRRGAPLALRMRPRSLNEVVGQANLLSAGSPLRRLVVDVSNDGNVSATSVILWGPPGTGKTTLASLVSTASGRRFVELSAVSAGVKDVREVVEGARHALSMQHVGTVLFVDEVHRFSKTQQDALLPAVENGWVTLIAATTENPSFSVVAPLLSRSLVLRLESLSDDDIRAVIREAVEDPRGFGGSVTLEDKAADHIVRIAGGDARRALTALEAAVGAAADDQRANVTVADVELAVDRSSVRYDRTGDQHYDVISAFIKSVRGSDVDAALHYLARMIEAGEDPRFIARRLVILASEDVGLADSRVLTTAVAAADVVALVGLPEGRIALSHATIELALAPKSNSACLAIDAAIADVRRGLIGSVPPHLRGSNYAGASDMGHGVGYVYPHNLPEAVAAQEYAPEPVRGRRYYQPTNHGNEQRLREVDARLQRALGRTADDEERERGPLGSDVANGEEN